MAPLDSNFYLNMSHLPHANARDHALSSWLETLTTVHGLLLDTLTPASGDASFRRYFRVQGAKCSFVVMDAAPPQENVKPFIDITQRLAQKGLNVPKIVAQNIDAGFLLLSDLGPTTYYAQIQSGLDETALNAIYSDAIDALVTLQKADHQGLGRLDALRLKRELTLFTDWYIKVHCNQTLTDTEAKQLDATFDLLSEAGAQQATVLVHRDFHSPNLMLSEQPQFGANPGVLDYQDALEGPIAYDIASLVFDARTTWEEPQQLDWAIRYWERARQHNLPIPSDFADFHKDYEWIGLQRNLRILGVFARLNHRDHKPSYLAHIPRVLAYIRQVTQRYGAFAPLNRILNRLEGIEVKARYTF
jgi:hypothetical protein